MQIDDLENYYLKAVEGIDENLLKDLDSWYQYVLQLSPHLQMVYTILVLNQQVFNGGFDQYFYNRYGLFVYEAIESFKQIGALKTAQIVDSVARIVNDQELNKSQFRKIIFNRDIDSLLMNQPEARKNLDLLTNEYLTYEEDVHQLLVDYLVKEGFN